MGKLRFSLDTPLPRRLQVLLLVAACLVPAVYVLKHFNPPPHFSRLILFAQERKDTALPEVRALNPPMDSPVGYDGQFYAQVAIHPLLTDPNLKPALDMPAYRSRRILMPVVAHLLGLGKPGLILEVYALINPACWFLLLFGMVRYLKAESARDYLCIFAAMFTTGSMVSLQRALTDLPATTLLFYVAALGTTAATGILILAVLTRETSALCLVKFAWPLPKTAAGWLALAARSALVIAPLLLWVAYVRHRFGSVTENSNLFAWPLAGWFGYMRQAWFNFTHMNSQALATRPLLPWHEALRHPGREWSRLWGVAMAYLKYPAPRELSAFELIAPLSLFVQTCFFAIRRSPESPYWRMGVVFAVLMLCMPASQEEIAYCRAVLPVTLAFNIELRKTRGRAFAFNFIAGNIGLAWGLHETLAYCFVG